MTTFSYPSYVLKALAEATVFQPTQAGCVATAPCCMPDGSRAPGDARNAAALAANVNAQS